MRSALAKLARDLDWLRVEFARFRRRRGKADGFASLDSSGRIPIAQLPAGTATWVLTGNGAGVDPSYQAPSGGGGGGMTVATGTITLAGRAHAGSALLGGLSSLTVGKPVLVWAVASDANELDQLSYTGVVESATSIRIYWWAPQLIASGSRSVYYVVGA